MSMKQVAILGPEEVLIDKRENRVPQWSRAAREYLPFQLKLVLLFITAFRNRDVCHYSDLRKEVRARGARGGFG
jgi:hypothetical protein